MNIFKKAISFLSLLLAISACTPSTPPSNDPTATEDWLVEPDSTTGATATRLEWGSDGSLYLTGVLSLGFHIEGLKFKTRGANDIYAAKLSPLGKVQWIRQIGGPNDDYTGDIAVDKSGNAYVTGSYKDSCRIDDKTLLRCPEGQTRSFIIKYNTDGLVQWVASVNPTKPAGRVQATNGKEIDVTPSGQVVVAGIFTNDTISIETPGSVPKLLTTSGTTNIYLMKLEADGRLVWAQSYGANDDFIGGMEVSGKENIFLSGAFVAKTRFGTFSVTSTDKKRTDAFVAKINPAGEPIWLKTGQGKYNECALGMGVDSIENVYVTGWHDDNFMFGTVGANSVGEVDGYVLKLNVDGASMAMSNWGGAKDDLPNSLELSPDGKKLYIATRCLGTTKFEGLPDSIVLPKDIFYKFAMLTYDVGTDLKLAKVESNKSDQTDMMHDVATSRTHIAVSGDFIDLFDFRGYKITKPKDRPSMFLISWKL